ncbi:malate synthase A [Metabacillus sp. RGM 3146]|uniref:malate synthase A n=1 Tax=Metabacillus sp. RGM 3146 TaxID=3401092 RepID=UPI003B98E488
MAIQVKGLQVITDENQSYNEILTPEALAFIEKLERTFGQRRRDLLEQRKIRQQEIDEGKLPDFLKETEEIRNSDWTVSELPQDLLDRRVEITGPVDRKMIINALNSGANVFMADFEDATTPLWSNLLDGQKNLKDAVRKTISLKQNDKVYELKEKTAVLKVRPRGWHLEEKHVLVDGKRMSGSLFDFGLYFFHNAKQLMADGSGPYFYLPKLESHKEARLWKEVFCFAEDELSLSRGTIKATVLIETITAAFEMDEILYELKQHSAGLNCGRWDYIFSYIKKLKNQESVILPDRSQVTMTVPFMRAYSQLVIKTCHKRNVHAIGGMAAQIPVKGNEEANAEAFEKVRADKTREARDGHDGTWVAHPALVSVAKKVFDHLLRNEPNQISKKREDVTSDAGDLLAVPDGTITEQGLRMNIDVGIRYLAFWLSGKGAAPIHNLMEDAATAEISRAQVWQWIRHPKGVLEDGREITFELYERLRDEEAEKIELEYGKPMFTAMCFPKAINVFDRLVKQEEFEDFLTLPCYESVE